MPEGLHLSPRHREAIEALLRTHLPDVEVWAYGSRVNGRSHDGSDLDLVLRGPKLVEIDASRLAELTEALRESTVPFLVEARDWARLPDSFHREIKREHVILVEGDGGKLAGQWLGVASGWQEVSLHECTVINDSTYSPQEAWPSSTTSTPAISLIIVSPRFSSLKSANTKYLAGHDGKCSRGTSCTPRFARIKSILGC